mgnify:CR=1 FL=1
MANVFGKLGRIISNIGAESFAEDLHALFIASVNVGSTKIAMWFINDKSEEIVGMYPLGEFSADGRGDINAGLLQKSAFETVDSRLMERVLIAREQHLIHFGTSTTSQAGWKRPHSCSSDGVFQVHLVSRKLNRRYLISLYRTCGAPDFTIQEMSLLKSYAEVLMPIVEIHASNKLCDLSRRPMQVPDDGERSIEHLTVRRKFESRLRGAAITLSDREIEVCAGLLSGSTFRELADKLGVKSSTIETYTKRAASKLGFKGRHGLVKWALTEP